MVRIGLRTDERTIQSNVDLFEEGMRYVVGQSHDVSCKLVSGIILLDHNLYLEVTLTDQETRLADPLRTSRG